MLPKTLKCFDVNHIPYEKFSLPKEIYNFYSLEIYDFKINNLGKNNLKYLQIKSSSLVKNIGIYLSNKITNLQIFGTEKKIKMGHLPNSLEKIRMHSVYINKLIKNLPNKITHLDAEENRYIYGSIKKITTNIIKKPISCTIISS